MFGPSALAHLPKVTFRASARAAVVCAAFGLASCSDLSPPTSAIEAESGDQAATNTATSILNAGVMTQMGAGADGSLKFLFDPLYDDHFGSLQQMPPELIAAIVSGAAPYDGVDGVFVSHAHGDHFSARHLTDMMVKQPQLQLAVPGQALEAMREMDGWSADLETRIHSIELENGEAAQAFRFGGNGAADSGAIVEAFRSPHSGWPDRHAATHNITFRVSVEGEGAAATVMHLGDADPAAEHYAALSDFLSARRSGLAMVPFWFYGAGIDPAIITEVLNAQSSVAVHVPVRVPAYLEDGEQSEGRAYFSGIGEVLEIPATR